ncbi:MAG: Gldg family protein [Alphaproteobacteria bacterium]|nr:Gldg family protein [Alphaproteobacteria bacterium]MDP6515165.1 Gldg family protein [Alphaproteobacteria bacterium]
MIKDRRFLAVIGIALGVVLLVALNVLSNAVLRNARIDLTEDRLFTLSDGSRNLLGGLEEPITLRFFFTRDLANNFTAIRDYGERVRELLEEYAAAANGMITLEAVDPEPFSDAEDDAVGYGLQGIPVSASGDRIYFGLVGTNTTDDESVVPYFQQEREQFLEYDLTRAIYDLSNPKKPVVGLITTLPVNGGMGNQAAGQGGFTPPWTVIQQITQMFELRELGAGEGGIDADVDVLLVIHPRDLAEEAQYAIDQFVLAGGKALIFVDPFSEVSASNPDPRNPMDTHNSNMIELFEAWGVELAPGMVVGDMVAARRVTVGGRGQQQVVPYIAWLDLRAVNFNSDEIATSQLERIHMGSSGNLRLREGAEIEFTPLIWTSPEAMEFERYRIQFRPDPIALLDNFVAKGEPFTLAARLRGMVKTAFPDGPPGELADEVAEDGGDDAGTNDVAAYLSESAEPINVVLVADSDMLADSSWVQVQDFLGNRFAVPFANNGVFAANTLDVLSGSDDMIGLRSRGTGERRFAVVDDLQRDAESRFRETERTLEARLEETEKKLADLRTSEAGGAPVLSPEQQVAIDEFRAEMVTVRKQLRDVRHELRKDIEGLGTWLKILNIGVVPILVGLVAVAVSLVRRRQRRRAVGLS